MKHYKIEGEGYFPNTKTKYILNMQVQNNNISKKEMLRKIYEFLGNANNFIEQEKGLTIDYITFSRKVRNKKMIDILRPIQEMKDQKNQTRTNSFVFARAFSATSGIR